MRTRQQLYALGLLFLMLLVLMEIDSLRKSVTLKEILSISTETLPVLLPHTHTQHDSVEDMGHGVYVSAPEFTVTEDTWIGGIRVDVNNAPRSVLHHVNITAVRPVAKEDELSAKERFLNAMRGIAVGQDSADAVLLPPPYAGFLPKGTRIQVTAMLHNPLPPAGPGGEYKDVSLTLHVFGVTFNPQEAKETASIFLSLADATSERGDTFTVPANTHNYVRDNKNAQDAGRGRLVFPISGTIVGMGAHTHAWQGGRQVNVFLNDQKLHSFIPRLGGGGPWDWHTDYALIRAHVDAGDVITLSAHYENESSEDERGAMAQVVLTFAPD